jgi:hypothetical protein
MFKKFILLFAVLAVAAAIAGTVPGIAKYRVVLMQPSVVQGTELKPGEYQLQLANNNLSFFSGKNLVAETPVTVEDSPQKFPNNLIRTRDINGKQNIVEIRIAGTKTKLVLMP